MSHNMLYAVGVCQYRTTIGVFRPLEPWEWQSLACGLSINFRACRAGCVGSVRLVDHRLVMLHFGEAGFSPALKIWRPGRWSFGGADLATPGDRYPFFSPLRA